MRTGTSHYNPRRGWKMGGPTGTRTHNKKCRMTLAARGALRPMDKGRIDDTTGARSLSETPNPKRLKTQTP